MLISAEEARKICDKHISSDIISNVMDDIDEAAREGKSSITIDYSTMTDGVKNVLKELGYTIGRAGANFVVSWE